MASLFSGICWGVVFYNKQTHNKFTGLNIQEVGHASGKFGNFMRHGIPVIYDGCGQFLTKEIRKYSLGLPLNDFLTNLHLAQNETAAYQKRCLEYYEKKLTPDRLEHFFARL